MFGGTGCELNDMITMVYDFTELRAHFEPTSETEGVDKDTDEVEDDYPLADLPGSEAHVASGGRRPGAAVAQEAQPHQQHLSLQLSKLRQESNR